MECTLNLVKREHVILPHQDIPPEKIVTILLDKHFQHFMKIMKSIATFYPDEKGKIHLKYLKDPDADKQFVIFLHGGSPRSQHTEFWAPLHEITADLCNPVYMDRFGHGKSQIDDKVGVQDHLRTITGVIDHTIQEYNLEQVVLIGRSLGGGLAARIAGANPEKLSGLGLIAPGSLKSNAKYLEGWEKPTNVLWDRQDPVVKFSYYPLLLEVVPHAKLFLIGQGDGEMSIERGGIKKTHAPELAAPHLYEAFLNILVTDTRTPL